MNCKRGNGVRYALAALSLLLAGCGVGGLSGDPSPRAAKKPVDLETVSQSIPALQVARVDPSLKGQRYSVLLNFELPSDDAFVVADSPTAADIDSSRAMTGGASLRVTPNPPEGAQTPAESSVAIKLSSLLVGRPFPAQWTLLGASVYAERPAQLLATLTMEDGGKLTRTQPIEPGRWSAAWIDITSLPPTAKPVSISFKVSGGAVWIDDLLMTDNTQWFVGASTDERPWSVHRRGYVIYVNSPEKFRCTFDTAEGEPGGWTIEEVCPFRLRLSSLGESRSLTIYADGRSFWDGQFRPLSPEARSEPAEQHLSPAGLTVAETMGRPDRVSVGDANNDGYNETRGAYQVKASGPRVDVTLTPRSGPLYRPILEIDGLPPGEAVITVAGRLVEQSYRTPDGKLLVPLPFRIDRATTVNVRVS